MFSVPIWNRSYTAFMRGPTGDLSMSSPSNKILYLWKYPTFSAPLTTLISAHTQEVGYENSDQNTCRRELCSKSLKNSCFGQGLCPINDILWCWRSVQVVSEPQSWVKWRGRFWLWPNDGWIKVNFMANSWRHLKWCSQKFAKKFTSIQPSFGQSQTPPLHVNRMKGSNTTWTLLQHCKMSRMGRTLYPKHEFWGTSRITLISRNFTYKNTWSLKAILDLEKRGRVDIRIICS